MYKVLAGILALIVLVAVVVFVAKQKAPPADNGGSEARTVQLYYYSEEKDRDAEGNIRCSAAGLVPVERTIPSTQTPLRDTIELLLRGELTAEERARGITTEYPLEGLALTSASIADGVATLTFDDPLYKTGGGACRVGILWAQLQATARQFEGVEEARFLPEELFQP